MADSWSFTTMEQYSQRTHTLTLNVTPKIQQKTQNNALSF